jgi:predicted phosphodiesterase
VAPAAGEPPAHTLVLSDLHLGTRGGSDVLREPDALLRLTAALEGARRLVLLGDVLELRHGPARDALAAAEPVLEAIGRSLGSEAEVVVVAGNHDHHVLAPWLARRGLAGTPAPLGLESDVDWRAQEPLAELAAALAPARLRAAYPGVWLRGDVYATHGHYGDVHTTVPMFERLGAGAMARVVGDRGRDPRRAEDYEAVLAPMYAWIHALAQSGRAGVGESSHAPSSRMWRALHRRRRDGRGRLRARALRVAVTLAVGALGHAGLGPLHADLSGAELRRAGLLAVGQALERLEVSAGHVIFGHTHRAGPLAADELAEWRTASGAQLHNCGCWVHERAFLGARPAESPYRAGFAIRLEPEGPPELVNLLDPDVNFGDKPRR